MKTVKGVFYFPSKTDAENWANDNDWPVDFIRYYTKGYAVQACDSGRYAGPNQTKYPGPDWINPIS